MSELLAALLALLVAVAYLGIGCLVAYRSYPRLLDERVDGHRRSYPSLWTSTSLRPYYEQRCRDEAASMAKVQGALWIVALPAAYLSARTAASLARAELNSNYAREQRKTRLEQDIKTLERETERLRREQDRQRLA